MGFRISENKEWTVLSVHDRIDSFNHGEFKKQLEEILASGRQRLALNLDQAEFLSLQSIKLFSSVAEELSQKGGKFALVATPEKLKRQIHIFASLDAMEVFRSEADWKSTSL